MSKKKPDSGALRQFSEALKTQLTDRERNEKAVALAAEQGELERKEGEKTALNATLSSEIKEAKARISTMTREINQGWVFMDVECHDVPNWDSLSVETVRTDSGEKIRERPMTEAERQRPLPLE